MMQTMHLQLFYPLQYGRSQKVNLLAGSSQVVPRPAL
jgi:hypothetical protein